MIYHYYQLMNKQEVKYPEYRALNHKEKQRMIKQAKQYQQPKPNPQGIIQFHQLGFFQFYVTEKHKKIRLQTYRHYAQGNPKGLIFMFHGLNSHVGHGAHLAQILSKQGFTTVGYDYRGFGRSEGKGGYVVSLEHHLEEALYFVHSISKMQEYKQLPKFALGLSMGGMTIYHLALNHHQLFDGVVLMAPALMHSFSEGLASFAKFAGKVLPQKMKLFKPVYGQASKNPQITMDVKKDQHAFSDRAILSTMDLLVNAMDSSPKTFHKFKSPFIIVQGALDKLVNPQIAFELYDNSQTPYEDKQILFYENLWHDIWHEDEIYDIMQKVIKWINGQIAKRPQKVEKQIPQQKGQQKQKQMSQQIKIENKVQAIEMELIGKSQQQSSQNNHEHENEAI